MQHERPCIQVNHEIGAALVKAVEQAERGFVPLASVGQIGARGDGDGE
jgi:hypothetical protein